MNDLNLLYTDVEDDLRSSVRDLLATRCPPEQVVGVFDGDRALAAPLWRALGRDLGLAGLLVPESYGGAGASAREAAVVLEELGRFVAPVPFLTSAVVATSALLGPTDTGLLEGLASGERTAALLVPLSADASVAAVVRETGDGLVGEVTSVAGALEGEDLVVPVVSGDGVALHVVAADAPGVEVRPVVSLDMTRQVADVVLSGATGRVVVPAASGRVAVHDALALGAALLASEQLGIADRCLADTVAYLRERRQFGRVVGGFQALKHRLADLYVQVESARAAARYAAATWADRDDDRFVATAVAQSYCSDAAVLAAEECVQLHGGIGMTWEHPAHLLLKRAKADQIAFGSPGAHRRRLADLIDLPAT